MRSLRLAALSAGLVLAGCNPSSPPADGGSVGHDAGHDASSPPIDTGPTMCPMTYSGCTSPEDHTSETAVTVTTSGFTYAPHCIRIQAGTTVTLPGESFHPLEGATCNPAGSPIPASAPTGGTFTFTTPGRYGFHCANHGADDGNGMAGLIVVE